MKKLLAVAPFEFVRVDYFTILGEQWRIVAVDRCRTGCDVRERHRLGPVEWAHARWEDVRWKINDTIRVARVRP